MARQGHNGNSKHRKGERILPSTGTAAPEQRVFCTLWVDDGPESQKARRLLRAEGGLSLAVMDVNSDPENGILPRLYTPQGLVTGLAGIIAWLSYSRLR
ncbi:MAG: hypothetical protein ABIH26_12740, partial [Candidatus Eisenbacteria bacterium]